MKKNLFGAVAAGLALALAITSFGCESGNDDPIARPEFADLAAVKGSKFTYVATPTEWTYKAAVDTLTAKSSATDGTRKGQIINYTPNTTDIISYTYDTFIDGVQNYNKVTAESWGKADKSKPVPGDVINTKSETIVLNAGDKTFTWTAASSAYEVKGIRLSASTTLTNGAAYDTLPFYFASTGTAFAADTDLPYYAGAVINTTTYDTEEKQWKAVEEIFGEEKDSGSILANAANDVKTKQTTWDTTFKGLTAQAQAAFNALTEDEKKSAQSEYAALVAAKEAQAKVVNFKALVALYKEGARYSILDTATKAGATTGNITYYAQKDGKIDTSKVIKTVSKAGGTAKDTASGVYTISTNDYKNATITLTTYKSGSDTIVFNSDDTYTKNGELQYHKVDVDFPKATASDATPVAYTGSKLQKAARELTIAAGKLTAPRFISSFTDKTKVGNVLKDYTSNNGFLLSSSWTSFDNAKADFDIVDGNLDKTLEKAVSYSYEFK